MAVRDGYGYTKPRALAGLRAVWLCVVCLVSAALWSCIVLAVMYLLRGV